MVQKPMLRGWKSIAGYLGISKGAALEYADHLELPVKKLGNGPNSPVFAFPDELDAWLRNALRPRRPAVARAG